MEYPAGNPNPTHSFHLDENFDPFGLEQLSDYFLPGDGFGLDDTAMETMAASSWSERAHQDANASGISHATECKRRENELRKKKVQRGSRVAFRTKSELEVMDDGYKWRKYGKKSVKNSPNPRNYYRCSVVGCPVKKRVERDRDDFSYVITTYEGVHNHNHNNETTASFSSSSNLCYYYADRASNCSNSSSSS
ncbi:hypothetical protein SAY87_009088 [Trapa incisa]|uniref:WRKY domain-containing protein n=1 Tax=Trapa incisa TaxID=236973 RepID=A0AAN7JW29_9MYRT|nr:hypothetical protein SAY87_009088 [Trapa incisa]